MNVSYTDEDRLAAEEQEPVDDELVDEQEEVAEEGDEEVHTTEENGTEGDEQEEESDDNPLIPIQYTDENGNLVTENIPYQDLGNIVLQAKRGFRDPDSEQRTKAVWDMYNDSDIIKQVIYYRAQGYTEKQIRDGLPQLWAQSQDQAQLTTEDGEVDVQKLVKQQVDHELTPLRHKLQQTEQQILEERISTSNEKVLNAALSKHGMEADKLNAQEVDALRKSLFDIYPNANLKQMMLTASQANVIVNDAFRNRKSANRQGAAVKNIIKQTGAPRVLSAKTSRDTGSRVGQSIDGISREDRARNFRNLF